MFRTLVLLREEHENIDSFYEQVGSYDVVTANRHAEIRDESEYVNIASSLRRSSTDEWKVVLELERRRTCWYS